jgi:uncharacterized protein YggU (UPF0235/DUF167 family)
LGRQIFSKKPSQGSAFAQLAFFGENAMATVFSARVRAGARRLCLSLSSQTPLVLRADIPKEPENDRANRFLLLELEKALGCHVELLAGHKSKRKTLAADCPQERIIEAMKQKRN